MTIQLGTYTGEKNKINKEFNADWSETGYLREGSDILNPSIMVEAAADTICGYNYAYIPEFKRWYFVQNVTSFRQGLTVVTMAVDVLMTYKESIMSSQSIITRSSKMGDGILSLPDDRFPVLQSDSTHTITFDSLYDDSVNPGKGQTMVLVMTGIDKPA